MTRFAPACGLNLLVPGTGLIWLGRPWLGMALAIWFGLGAQVAACGGLIAPATIPRPATVLGGLLAVAAWLVGQGLLVSRIRFLRDPSLPGELAALREHAESCLARGDHKAARSALTIALSIDGSDLATRILWARLVTATSSRFRSRRAWRGAARLDSDRRFQAEIREGLEGLRSG